MKKVGSLAIRAALSLAVLLALSPFANARASQSKLVLPTSANELVRMTIANELKQLDDDRFYAFIQSTEKPRGTTTKEMVETPDGVIGRVVAVNGKPLSQEQRRAEDDRINRLLDPKQMRDKAKEQKEDQERTTKLVRSLPDAFIYTYDGPPEGNIVRLKFTPNPDFDPPSRETLVFQGMAGVMVIDAAAMHLAKVDGTMTRDVNIGWGIIGHLDRGGHFYAEQAEVDKGHWDIVKMNLNFTGKAFFFKNIRIKQTETLSAFRRVPRMNVAQALEFLRKRDAEAVTASTK
ncbi:MAG TPA: hypothetical protein VN622_06195 [Clostridia bacterium]|nr:hypothetical protein [Clostridia bacterium]